MTGQCFNYVDGRCAEGDSGQRLDVYASSAGSKYATVWCSNAKTSTPQRKAPPQRNPHGRLCGRSSAAASCCAPPTTSEPTYERDVATLVGGMRRIRRIAGMPALAGVIKRRSSPAPGRVSRRLSSVDRVHGRASGRHGAHGRGRRRSFEPAVEPARYRRTAGCRRIDHVEDNVG